MTDKPAQNWDSALYDDRHSFVWKKGEELLELLAPKDGERILDLGCGTGHLTAKIAESGASVIGIDSSPDMIAQARQNFPKLTFRLADATAFTAEEPFDAVFSNAVLHWVTKAEAAVERIAAVLRPGGRLVLEMGGRGNTQRVVNAVEDVLRAAGYKAQHRWYYPSVATYTALLEKHGFEIDSARLFQRWTRLEHPERGLREWLEMFGGAWFEDVPASAKEALLREIEAVLRPQLWCDGAWFIDYKRLRLAASLADRTQSGIPIPR